MSRSVLVAIGAIFVVLLGGGFVLLREADARRIWQRCNQAGFSYGDTERELDRTSWLNRVHCEGGRCRWRTWLNTWTCEVVDEAGVARQGGSG